MKKVVIVSECSMKTQETLRRIDLDVIPDDNRDVRLNLLVKYDFEPKILETAFLSMEENEAYLFFGSKPQPDNFLDPRFFLDYINNTEFSDVFIKLELLTVGEYKNLNKKLIKELEKEIQIVESKVKKINKKKKETIK